MWMLWRPLAALGEFIMYFATVTAGIAATAGLLALCTHFIGPTRQTVLLGWVTWRWHRRTTRRFAHSIATGDLEGAEEHARTLLGPSRVRHATRTTATSGGNQHARRRSQQRRSPAT